MYDILDSLPDFTDEERLAIWESEIVEAEDDGNIGEEFIAVVRLCRKLMDERNMALKRRTPEGQAEYLTQKLVEVTAERDDLRKSRDELAAELDDLGLSRDELQKERDELRELLKKAADLPLTTRHRARDRGSDCTRQGLVPAMTKFYSCCNGTYSTSGYVHLPGCPAVKGRVLTMSDSTPIHELGRGGIGVYEEMFAKLRAENDELRARVSELEAAGREMRGAQSDGDAIESHEAEVCHRAMRRRDEAEARFDALLSSNSQLPTDHAESVRTDAKRVAELEELVRYVVSRRLTMGSREKLVRPPRMYDSGMEARLDALLAVAKREPSPLTEEELKDWMPEEDESV